MTVFLEPPRVTDLSPEDAMRLISEWQRELVDQLTESFREIDALVDAQAGPSRLIELTVSQLESVNFRPARARQAYCLDAPGGPAPVYADGVNWRLFKDGTVVA